MALAVNNQFLVSFPKGICRNRNALVIHALVFIETNKFPFILLLFSNVLQLASSNEVSPEPQNIM